MDEHGVLTGFDETGQAEGVPVPAGCDLEPGKYHYDTEQKRWHPIRKMFRGPVGTDAMLAIALGFRALRDGRGLPRYTLEWLKRVEKSGEFDRTDPEDR